MSDDVHAHARYGTQFVFGTIFDDTFRILLLMTPVTFVAGCCYRHGRLRKSDKTRNNERNGEVPVTTLVAWDAPFSLNQAL